MTQLLMFFFFLSSSVTACFLQLGWVAWLKMRPQYQPARQKSPLSLKKDDFITADIILPDVFLIQNGFVEIKISYDLMIFCGKQWTLMPEFNPVKQHFILHIHSDPQSSQHMHHSS